MTRKKEFLLAVSFFHALLPRHAVAQNFNTPEYTKYLLELEQRLSKHWVHPPVEGYRNTAVVFRLHEGGELSNLRLDQSSGLAKNDQAVLKAVENGAPYPASPSKKALNFAYEFTPGGVKLLKVEAYVQQPITQKQLHEWRARKVEIEQRAIRPDANLPTLAIPRDIIDTTKLMEERRRVQERILRDCKIVCVKGQSPSAH